MIVYGEQWVNGVTGFDVSEGEDLTPGPKPVSSHSEFCVDFI